MNKILVSALIGIPLAFGAAVAESKFSPGTQNNKVSVVQVRSLAYNGTALVAVLGNPDIIKPIAVGKSIVASTWTYKNRALDARGKAVDVYIILGDDGFAKAVSVEGDLLNVIVNGQDEFAGTENVSDIPA